MSTLLLPPSPVRKTSPMTSSYAALSKQVKDEGLLGRKLGFYIIKFVITIIALMATIGSTFLIGNSWYQLIPAAILGVIFTQIAFMAHEASHRQIFTSGKLNDRAGLVLANFFVGLSYGWWMNKHSKHHANPNLEGKDPDIAIRALAFTPDQAKGKKGISAFVTKRQGYLFFPLLTLTGLDLMVSSIGTIFGKGQLKNRLMENVLFIGRFTIYLTLLFFFLNPFIALAFLGVQLAIFGVYMGGSFAPNHKGMPVLPSGTKLDFLRKQVLTSRNIYGGKFMDNLMGGLNYQIEHHLFPSMARPHLKRTQEIVKEYCAKENIPYLETSLPKSYKIIVAYLNDVGLAARDPFECPMISQMRRRD